MPDLLSPFRKLGHATVERIWRLGFCGALPVCHSDAHSGSSFRRLHLTLREIVFFWRAVAADHSCFGAVCRPGARPSGYGNPAALRLDRGAGHSRCTFPDARAGPVVAGLLFASRRLFGDGGNRPDEGHRTALKAMDMMAVNPIARVVAPRFWGGAQNKICF